MPKRYRRLKSSVSSRSTARSLGHSLTTQALKQRSFHTQGLQATTRQLQSLGHHCGRTVVGGVKLAGHIAIEDAILYALLLA